MKKTINKNKKEKEKFNNLSKQEYVIVGIAILFFILALCISYKLIGWGQL